MRTRFRTPIIAVFAVTTAFLLSLLVIPAMAIPLPAVTGAPTQRVGTSSAASAQTAEMQASIKAHKTGAAVAVDALTTPTSITTANPSGSFTLTQTILPSRVKRGHAWLALDPTLRKNTDGTLSPVATTSGLVLSGGGNRPLATMTEAGHSLSIGWPNPLPSPSINGAMATYHAVLPGVNLVVTANDQGGFSDTLVVETRAAATDPGLASLRMAATATNGLRVSADAAGNLSAASTGQGAPVFWAPAPSMWDSSTTAPSTGTKASSAAKSTVTSPGVHARRTTLTTSVEHPADDDTATSGTAGGTTVINLAPAKDILTGPATVFPVYIDPSWNPIYAGGGIQAWGSVSSALPGTNEYDSTYDPTAHVMQVGYAGPDFGFVGRSYFRVSISPALQNHAQIISSQINFPIQGGANCSDATPVDLWWSGSISDPLTYDNGPKPWNGSGAKPVATANVAGCAGKNVGFNVSSFMASKAPGNGSMTFALRAPDESNDLQWKELWENKMTMATEYDHAPALSSHPATSPGGPCQTGTPAQTVIGNDDIQFETVAADPDGGQLGTEFVIKNYNGSTVYDSGNPATAAPSLTSTSGQAVPLTIGRGTIQGWHPDGATKAYQYSWYTVTSDGRLTSPTTGIGSQGSPCTFTYDPTAPAAPGIAVSATGWSLGSTATLTLAPCAGALATTPTTCSGTSPARYSYQIDDGAPADVTATGTTQTTTIHLTHFGPNTVTVYAKSAGGNPGPNAVSTFVTTAPATPYTDGDINGDGKPDLLAYGTGEDPGLWLAAGDGAGNLATPTDIGNQGTGLSSTPTPAQWAGALVAHGDFTGDHVQDVIAYYPTGTSAGAAELLYGSGDSLALTPTSGSHQDLAAGTFGDTTLNQNANSGFGDYPMELVAAGNASLTNAGIADLIGIAGDSANGYELDEWTSPAAAGGYGNTFPAFATLASPSQSPDNAADWNNYTVLTAQPGGNTVLFALNKVTGALWESTNPGQSTSTLIGSAASTWTQIGTLPWNSATVPNLTSADVTSAGTIELWAQSGVLATAYTVTGTTATAGAANSLLDPAHEWPLSDGSGTTATDRIGGDNATLSGAAGWGTDPTHGTVATLDGQSGYIALPNKLIDASDTLTLSLSFQATPGSSGILFATGSAAPGALSPSAMPVMYIGVDGRLYAQFWNGYVRPMISPQRVNDGQWHTVTLASDGSNQSLFLDDNVRVGMAGSPPVNNVDDYNEVGAGVFTANTATKTWINAPGNGTTTRASYFSGAITNISLFTTYLLPDQVTPFNIEKPTTGAIDSSVANGLCIDDRNDGTANNNPIQIHTCNNTDAQQWTITPETDGVAMTITHAGKCLSVAGSGTTDGTLVDLYTCNGTPADNWTVDSDGQLWNPHAGKCLDDPSGSTTDGTQLQIHDCNYTNAQNWQLP